MLLYQRELVFRAVRFQMQSEAGYIRVLIVKKRVCVTSGRLDAVFVAPSFIGMFQNRESGQDGNLLFVFLVFSAVERTDGGDL